MMRSLSSCLQQEAGRRRRLSKFSCVGWISHGRRLVAIPVKKIGKKQEAQGSGCAPRNQHYRASRDGTRPQDIVRSAGLEVGAVAPRSGSVQIGRDGRAPGVGGVA
jgi:hypothetical protein